MKKSKKGLLRKIDTHQFNIIRVALNILYEDTPRKPVLPRNKIGRNILCVCGSGLKNKKCNCKKVEILETTKTIPEHKETSLNRIVIFLRKLFNLKT